jgi:hypothetical protein
MMNKFSILLGLAACSVAGVAQAQKPSATKPAAIPAGRPTSSHTSFLVGGADNCATPDAISGAGPFNFDNSTASTGAEGQGNAACLAFGTTGIDSDVWFTWTAGNTGLFQLSLCGATAFDSKVAIYDGNGCPAAAAIACNDDSCLAQSEFYFNGVNGNAYTIQVGAYPGTAGGTGSFTITFDGPVGPTVNADNCAAPTALTGNGVFRFDTTTATTGTQGQSESLCSFFGTTTIASDVWATWPSTVNGTATISFCGGSILDTKLAVYQASSCPTSGSAIACNDDTCHLQSYVSFNVTCGTTYLIQIGRYVTALGGAGYFAIEAAGSSCNPGTPFCFGDGTGTACPCGNSGAPGNGCASSVNAAGGNLAGTGTPSIGNDTLVLSGSGMPNSSALYFQGTSQISSAFGDGLRCAGGAVIRLGTESNAAGASQYPSGAELSVHLRGLDNAGDVRSYQCWYRNAAAFCTPSTFNLTNGFGVTWQP